MTRITDIWIAVHQAAQSYAAAVESVALCRAALSEGYERWKRRNQVESYIDKDSLQWQRMMSDTKPLYTEFVKAKSRERRAKQKLLQAVEVRP